MEKVPIGNLVDFNRLVKQGPKMTLIKNLNKPKAETSGNGGDYWVSSISACAATFWNNDKKYLDEKIYKLKDKIEATPYKKTKNQFQKNIDILFSMQDYDFESLVPNVKLKKQSLNQNIILVNELPIQVRPQYLFSYIIEEKTFIGGVWFIAKKGGYKDAEIGMFATALYKYLTKRYSDKFVVNPDYCVGIDVSRVKEIRYTKVLKGQLPDLLHTTIVEFRKLL